MLWIFRIMSFPPLPGVAEAPMTATLLAFKKPFQHRLPKAPPFSARIFIYL